MNKVIQKGNLVRDPEVRVVEVNGRKTSVVNFTLAVSRYFKRANGEKGKETTFIPCEVWDTAADTMGKYLTKGSPLLIEGTLKNESWEKDGQKHSTLKCRVQQFYMLGGKPQSNDKPQSDDTPTSTEPVVADVDTNETGEDPIPF